jgi:branched-chain amino acid transport system substrate-binding protein
MQGIGKKLGLLVVVLSVVAATAAAGSFSAQQAQCNGTKPASATAKYNTYNNTIPAPNPKAKNYGQSKAGSCIYKGAGYFNLNLNKCPSDWNNRQGITNTSINLWTSMPHSGALAVYGGIGDGMKAYFNYVNARGGIAGRKINVDIFDDQLAPDITRKNADEAIQGRKYAASFAILGTSNNLAIWDRMNQQCMPQLMTASSDDQFTDTDTHPWTTLFGLSLYNETQLWVTWLKTRFPNGGKIAIVQIDNGQGRVLAAGVRRAIRGSNFSIVASERHPGTAATIRDQITNVAASNADIFLVLEAGSFCIQALAGIERTSWRPDAVIVANSCAQISTVFQPLLSQGATGNNTRMIRYYYVPTDEDSTNNAFERVYTASVRGQGLNPADAQVANGWFWGWYVVQVLKDASLMKGGLNRANITVATHQYESQWPLMMAGVKAKTRGKLDAFPFEAGQMYRYTGASGNNVGRFVKDGPLVNNEGMLKNWANIING